MTAWLIVAVFIVTFVLVCAIAYLLLARSSDCEPARDSQEASTWEGKFETRLPVSLSSRRSNINEAGHPVDPLRINDDVSQTLRNGAVLAYRLLEWFRTGPPDPDAMQPPVFHGPVTVLTLAAAVAVIGVGLLVFLGVIAVGLTVFEYGFEPILKRVSGPFFLLLLVPGVLPVLALTVLAIGLPLSRKFRPRGRFVTGLSAVALGFVCLWQLPKVMARLPTPEARVELEAPLLIVGLIVSGFLLVCGFQLMGSCEWVREQEGGDDNE